MIVMFVVASLLATLLILPGWLWLRRTRPQTSWLLALPFVSMALWVALAALGVGAQSLSNVIELLVVAASAIVFSYFKFFVFDRSAALSGKGAVIAFLLVGLVVFGLRLFMPVLPE
jgi:hypothetical protein